MSADNNKQNAETLTGANCLNRPVSRRINDNQKQNEHN